jgi:hypothetical protein
MRTSSAASKRSFALRETFNEKGAGAVRRRVEIVGGDRFADADDVRLRPLCTGPSYEQLGMGCCRSSFADECRRLPKPVGERLAERRTAPFQAIPSEVRPGRQAAGADSAFGSEGIAGRRRQAIIRRKAVRCRLKKA